MKINNLSRHVFLRNVFTVAFGTAMAQIITMLLSPILTRVYPAEAIGALGVFMSFVAVFSQVAAITLPEAIVLPKEDNEAVKIVNLSIVIGFAFSSILFLLFLFFGNFIASIFQVSEASQFILLVPLQVFFYTCVKIGQQWMLRKKRFKLKAKLTVIDKLIVNFLQILIGFILPTSLTLVYIYIFGQALFSISLLILSGVIYLTYRESRNFSLSDYKVVLKKYSDFPKFRAPQVFINALSDSLPILILTSLFGPAFAGFYTLTKKVLYLPTNLIGNSIGDVFFPRIAEAQHKGENLFEILFKATSALVLLGIVPYSVIIIWGPELFSILFGDGWRVAGIYARWMSIWTYFIFVSRPSIKILPIINAQQFLLFFTILKVVFTTLALVVGGIIFNSHIYAIMFFSIVDSLLYFIFVISILYRTYNYRK